MQAILTLFSNIYSNKKSLLIFIFISSVFVSLLFLSFFRDAGPSQHRVPATDYQTYYEPIANSIFSGKGPTIKGKLITAVPPGYPAILSGIFALSHLSGIGELGLVVAFNVIITAIACCFLFLFAELIFNKRIALIASFLWLSYPFNLWFIKNPNTEVPFILFLYLGIYFFIFSLKKMNWKYIFLAGIFFGFASLVRPIALLLSLFLALLIIFFSKNTFRKGVYLFAIVLLIGNILAVLPWEMYVFSQTGNIIPLSTLGPGAFNAGFTFALRTGAGGDEIAVSSDVRALMERADAENFNSGTDILYFCINELENNPISFFKFLKLKAARSWYATSSKWYEDVISIVQIPYLFTAFLGIMLSIKIHRKKIKNIILLLGVIAYFWIMTIFAHSILRYIVPVMGLVIIFSAITINALYEIFSFNNNSLSE